MEYNGHRGTAAEEARFRAEEAKLIAALNAEAAAWRTAVQEHRTRYQGIRMRLFDIWARMKQKGMPSQRPRDWTGGGPRMGDYARLEETPAQLAARIDLGGKRNIPADVKYMRG